MTIWEVRTHSNPRALPLGTSTISRHRSAEAAFAAVERERRRFARSIYAMGGGYLQRIIVEIAEDGTERRVMPDDDAEDVGRWGYGY